MQCAALAVPVDWSRPDGPTIDLALARRQATNPAARIDSLVVHWEVPVAPASGSPPGR